MKDLDRRLRAAADDEAVRYDPRRHARVMAGVTDAAPADADARTGMPAPPGRRVGRVRTAVGVAFVFVAAVVSQWPAATLPPTPVARHPVPATRPASPPIASPDLPAGMGAYARLLLDHVDRACSVGRPAA